MKSQLVEKDSDAGKDQRQKEKGLAEDDVFGWHHQLNGHEFEQTLEHSGAQRSLVCCSPWGSKELDPTSNYWTITNFQVEFPVTCFPIVGAKKKKNPFCLLFLRNLWDLFFLWTVIISTWLSHRRNTKSLILFTFYICKSNDFILNRKHFTVSKIFHWGA